MSLEFKFVENPELADDSASTGIYDLFAKALRARPGQWAEWPRPIRSRGTAAVHKSAIKRGTKKQFPKGEFEARLAATGTMLYVRYIGEVKA